MKPGATGFGFIGPWWRRGVENRVVDSASIEVNRRARRTKTDRIDALKLVMMLVRVCCGEPRVFAEVRVPSRGGGGGAASESRADGAGAGADAAAQSDRQLAGDVRLPRGGADASAGRRGGPAARDWADAPLPAPVQARIARAEARLAIVAEQIATIDASQQGDGAAGRTRGARSRASCSSKASQRRARPCCSMKAWCGARFRIGGKLGACWGFAPAKYDSGESERDQGISRAGNKRLQSVMVQLGVGLGALATTERADPVVSGALWPGETRAPGRHRRPRAQAVDRALAVCDRRCPPGGRGLERRVVR